MSITGAILAAGIALITIAVLGALFCFAWGMATLEVDGTRRARPVFIALAACLVTIILGAAMIGATT